MSTENEPHDYDTHGPVELATPGPLPPLRSYQPIEPRTRGVELLTIYSDGQQHRETLAWWQDLNGDGVPDWQQAWLWERAWRVFAWSARRWGPGWLRAGVGLVEELRAQLQAAQQQAPAPR
jgi:hypothetical protein